MQRQPCGERGVSPVFGGIVLVAVTVILAATAASFVVGISQQELSQPPTTVIDDAYEPSESSQTLVISHSGGDPIVASDLRVVVAGARCSTDVDPNGRYEPTALHNRDARIAAGSALQLDRRSLRCGTNATDRLDLSGATVTLVWLGADGATSSTLWRWTGPSA